jgi:uncharacterized membrane protein YcaP (DUF421 family)
MFFSTWFDIFRVVVLGTVGYIGLIIILRVSGKRTLAKLNMFDFVITIALGSLFATLILSDSVTLAEGLTAIGLLVGLQFMVAWLSVRSKFVRTLVKGSPKLVFYEGEYLYDRMRVTRITGEAIRAAARSQGVKDMDDLYAVVLETNGELNAIGSRQASRMLMKDVDVPG